MSDETGAGDGPPDIPDISEAHRAPVAFGALLFGFGLAAGFLLAFSGYAVLQDSASLIVTVFLSAIFVIALVGTLLVFLRRPLLRRVFGLANIQLERFAGPLAGVAEAAVDRDPTRATASARDLVRLSLARYAWLSTRRWIVASLTGLIAAMAALAGTALLFKQNELLAVQSRLLAEQNDKLQAQSAFLAQDVQLAEAARNAQLAVEITRISEALGEALERSAAARRVDDPTDEGADWAARVPVLDPARDIPGKLMMRITSASRAVKPYRFLAPELRAHDDSDKIRVAMQPRRAELPQSYAAMERFFGWRDPEGVGELISRPASPERAQLMQAMIQAGWRDFEVANWFGLDLSHAWAPDTDLLGVSMQGARLAYAVFDRGQIRQSDFRGAALENIGLRKTVIVDSQFGQLDAASAKGPYRADAGEFPTFLAGADLRGAILRRVDMAGVRAAATRFDGAVLEDVDFSDATLGSATFRGAVVLKAGFSGAGLQSVEFDGALVFSEGFLEGLGVVAAPGTFRSERFVQEPATMDDVMAVPVVYANYDAAQIIAITGSDRVWRLRRVAPFETAPGAPAGTGAPPRAD